MAQSTAMDAASARGGFDAEEIVDGAFATVRPKLIEIVESLRRPVTPVPVQRVYMTQSGGSIAKPTHPDGSCKLAGLGQ